MVRLHQKGVAMKLAKVIVTIITALAISVTSACIASKVAKKDFDPREMKCWVEEGFVYLETPDGNVWIHEIE